MTLINLPALEALDADGDFYDWEPESQAEWEASLRIGERVKDLAERRASEYLRAIDASWRWAERTWVEIDGTEKALIGFDSPYERDATAYAAATGAKLVPGFMYLGRDRDGDGYSAHIPTAMLWDRDATLAKAAEVIAENKARLAKIAADNVAKGKRNARKADLATLRRLAKRYPDDAAAAVKGES